MILGEKIKHLRGSHGMNQAQLARRAAVSQATISRLESGQQDQVSLGTLRRLAHALRTPVGFLMSESEEPSISDWVEVDPDLKALVDVYLHLSQTRRDQLLDFSFFLHGGGPQRGGEEDNGTDDALLT